MAVAAIGIIPEPETYAMLLAGLGLLGLYRALLQDCFVMPDPEPQRGRRAPLWLIRFSRV